MAKLIIRFYGRFISAVETSEGAPTGVIELLASRFDDREFRPHKTILSVATIHVDSEECDIEPMLMVSAPQDQEGARAETVLWDLDGCEVTLPGAGTPSATLGVSSHSQDFPLLDLNNLVQRLQQNRSSVVLRKSALSVGSETQAVVHITQGIGTVHRMLRPEITSAIRGRSLGDTGKFVTAADAKDGKEPKQDRIFGDIGANGDVVDVGMGEVIDFEIDLPVLEPFTFVIGGKKQGRITVRALFDNQVVTASFSSLCASLPTNEHYDLEFEQFYRALTPETDPGSDALVPRPLDDGGEPASCQRSVGIRFDKQTGVAV